MWHETAKAMIEENRKLLTELNAFSNTSLRLPGTVRSLPFAETIVRARDLMDRLGITRVSNVTGLDIFDLPVWQAVRPLSRNLSVSQGKGLTHEAAQASALMECIEMWHAERSAGELSASIGEVVPELTYDFDEMMLPVFRRLPSMSIDWKRSLDITAMSETWLPLSMVTVDFREDVRGLNLSCPTSTGLASGNSYIEACLHAIYECIERDAVPEAADLTNRGTLVPHCDVVPAQLERPLDIARKFGFAFSLETFNALGDVPTFRASLRSPDGLTFCGAGTHLDTGIAASRAITECFQSRVTFISGSRDDIDEDAYRRLLHRSRCVAGDLTSIEETTSELRGSSSSGELNQDLWHLIRSLERRQLRILVSDLSVSDVGIPVVFVKLLRGKE
jgi:ribosomal protein S12 methylthiotransferase accessory factor